MEDCDTLTSAGVMRIQSVRYLEMAFDVFRKESLRIEMMTRTILRP